MFQHQAFLLLLSFLSKHAEGWSFLERPKYLRLIFRIPRGLRVKPYIYIYILIHYFFYHSKYSLKSKPALFTKCPFLAGIIHSVFGFVLYLQFWVSLLVKFWCFPQETCYTTETLSNIISDFIPLTVLLTSFFRLASFSSTLETCLETGARRPLEPLL